MRVPGTCTSLPRRRCGRPAGAKRCPCSRPRRSRSVSRHVSRARSPRRRANASTRRTICARARARSRGASSLPADAGLPLTPCARSVWSTSREGRPRRRQPASACTKVLPKHGATCPSFEPLSLCWHEAPRRVMVIVPAGRSKHFQNPASPRGLHGAGPRPRAHRACRDARASRASASSRLQYALGPQCRRVPKLSAQRRRPITAISAGTAEDDASAIGPPRASAARGGRRRRRRGALLGESRPCSALSHTPGRAHSSNHLPAVAAPIRCAAPASSRAQARGRHAARHRRRARMRAGLAERAACAAAAARAALGGVSHGRGLATGKNVAARDLVS